MSTEAAGPCGSPLTEGLGVAAGALCACKDRPADQCPGEWEPGCDLGANAAHAAPASQAESDAVDLALGLKMISIRLPAELIEKYKALAAASGAGDWRGTGYQRLMRQALADFAAQSVTPNVISANQSQGEKLA